MKAFYADHFVLPLPQDHRFPMSKYARLREKLLSTHILADDKLYVPSPATDIQILRAHQPHYLAKVVNGTLSASEIRRIGFPWSPQMVERSRRSVGGTIGACLAALEDGIGINLAGGTHHAGSEHGEGYCVFNDSAIAARMLQKEYDIRRIAIIDCDVHQGNGTAAILRDDKSIFTFSIHGENNFPFRKVAGDLDIGLPNNTSDEVYLETLEIALERVLCLARPEFAIYISGADPYIGDTLGKLALTKEGLARRDKMVIETCRAENIPIAISMGGGYAKDIGDIVDIHATTVAIAKQYDTSC